MIKRVLVGTGFVSLVAVVACSSSSTPPELPLRTSDQAVMESSHGYYDTVMMGAPDANGSRSVVWQHTTPEQYAYEVAVHTGKIPPDHLLHGPGGTTIETMVEDTGSCDSYYNDVWFYNYLDISGGACVGLGGGNVRACVHNTDSTNWLQIFLGSSYGTPSVGQYQICNPNPPYQCWNNDWAYHVRMFWPGNEDGEWEDNNSDFSTFSGSGQACTQADTTTTNATSLHLK
jgi:hypothetical protein